MHAPDIERWERTRTQLAKNNLDALVCRLTENVLQLSGYWPILGRSVVIFPREGEPVLLAPVSEEGEAERGWISDVRTFRAWRIGDIDPEASLTKLLHQFFPNVACSENVSVTKAHTEILQPPRDFSSPGLESTLSSPPG
jgi:Xaa-Pro aminopeptidase